MLGVLQFGTPTNSCGNLHKCHVVVHGWKKIKTDIISGT
jgi:hypothetical protein